MALPLLAITTLEAKPWLEKKAEGWAWYESQKLIEEIEPEQILTASAQMRSVRREIDESLSQAILKPTMENIKAYLTLQKRWVDKSAHFADNWRRVVLQNPELDESLAHPTNQLGIQVMQQMKGEERRLKFQEYSSQYGLMFFFEGGNPLSGISSTSVKLFAEKYHWDVMPVSLDGRGNQLFPHPEENIEIAHKIVVVQAPSIYLVNPRSEQWRIVGRGQLSEEQLEQNILNELEGGVQP